MHLDGALAWWDAGMAVIPARADGSKRPVHQWSEFMSGRPSRELVASWYTENPQWGVGIVCGQVSGGLELLEIEAVRMGGEHLDRIRTSMEERGVLDIWDEMFERGYCEFTPSGGIHFLYRIADQPVPGNQKIAMSENSKVTYAETRGEGGFVIVAPSSGSVHPSGESWDAAGESKVGVVYEITWDDRQAIHAALKDALDERVLPVYERPAGMAEYDRSQGDRPGDAFNDDPAQTIHDILLRNGWKYLGRKQGQDEYVHPHSSDMSTGSARTGKDGSPNLYAWSGMPQEGSYDKFAVLAHLEYGGDFSACSAALRRQGYGSERVVDMDDWNTEPTAVPTGVAEQPAAPELTEFSHTGVAQFAERYILANYRMSAQENFWRLYESGRWTRDMTGEVDRAAQRVSERVKKIAVRKLEEAKATEDKDEISVAKSMVSFASSCRSSRGTTDLVKAFSRLRGARIAAEDFDHDVNLIAMANGTFDLGRMELRKHDPNDLLTKRINIVYDPQAKAERWNRFLEEVLPDPAMREFIQDAVGMTLLGRMEEAAFFLLHGDSGCGKSQFLAVIEAVMGEYAATATASAFRVNRQGEKSTTDLHALRGARFVSTSETPEGAQLDEELIKRITGGDTVTSRGLYQENVTWKPRFTMWMATNHLPRMSADDNAIWRRVNPIEFPISFYKEGRVPERGLAQKMIASELAGIFNWVLEGAQRYVARGLKKPEQVLRAIGDYRADLDPVRNFFLEAGPNGEGRLLLDDEYEMRSSDLYQVYVAWCGMNNIRPMGDRRFGMRLTDLGYSTKKGSGGIRMRVGVKINPAYGFASAQKSNEKYW